MLDEFQIAGTDLYVKKYLLEKLTPYKPETQLRNDCTTQISELVSDTIDHSDLNDVVDLLCQLGERYDLTDDGWDELYNNIPCAEYIAVYITT